ncbi:unnamed protein product [Rotaria sp. Silwood1]|nr:unnamed protein product [Rotaria sp. Silwood1]
MHNNDNTDEIDYTSDETSNDEDDIQGIDEEMKITPNIEKKLKQMNENGSEVDFDNDNDDEDILDLYENDEKNGTVTAHDLSNVDMESSSNNDSNLDALDDLKKESIVSISQIIRAIKSKVMCSSSSSSHLIETITEDKIRNLLLQKHYMTFTELIQYFLPKTEYLRIKEIKEDVVQK